MNEDEDEYLKKIVNTGDRCLFYGLSRKQPSGVIYPGESQMVSSNFVLWVYGNQSSFSYEEVSDKG